MAAGQQVKFDKTSFVRAMREVERETGRDMNYILNDVMRLWAQDIVKRTGGDPRKGLAAQKRQLKDAITQDLNKIFVSMDDTAVLAQWQSEVGGKDLFRISDDGETYRLKRRLLQHGQGKMRQWHQQHRKKSTGRTWMPRDRGYAWGGRMPVPAPAFDKYEKDVQKRVGLAKAGWNSAANHFGAKVPAWVRKQGARGGPGWIDTLGNDLRGTLAAMNMAPHVKQREQREVDFIGRKRLRDLQGGHYAKRMQKTMDKHQGKR